MYKCLGRDAFEELREDNEPKWWQYRGLCARDDDWGGAWWRTSKGEAVTEGG